jgi:mono/diheme cytochrome c family protein
MKNRILLIALIPLAFSEFGCLPDDPSSKMPPLVQSIIAPSPQPNPENEAAQKKAELARGEHLVLIGACNDCHTPLKMGPNGPEPDMARMLSGHPEGMPLPPAPAPSGPWLVSAAATNTAWAGPWGVSFTANITPDDETGLGKWTFENFKQAIRTGRHMGQGRPILPPMPYPMYKNLDDEELHAMFAYLQSIPAMKNRVPEPLPPAAPPGATPTGDVGPLPKPGAAAPSKRG